MSVANKNTKDPIEWNGPIGLSTVVKPTFLARYRAYAIVPIFFWCIHDNFRTHQPIDFKFCTSWDYAKVGKGIANENNRKIPKLFLGE